jgi:hypothetical protein
MLSCFHVSTNVHGDLELRIAKVGFADGPNSRPLEPAEATTDLCHWLNSELHEQGA